MNKRVQQQLALFKLTGVLKKMSDDELIYIVKVIDKILKKRKDKGLKYVK